MRKIILILTVVISSICANAQIDTAAMRQYLMTHESKTELIDKCRNRIFEAIIDNDRSKAEGLMFFAKTEYETNKLKAMSQDELWLLAIWVRNYQLAATEMVLDSLTIEEYKNKANIFKYSLFPLLADSIHVNNAFYRNDIENDESLSESRRDFLLLFIKNFELTRAYKSSEAINDACDEYLALHPMSEHETFVRNLIRYKYINTRPTFEFRISGGAASYSGNFGNLLNTGFAIDFYAGLSFHNFVLNGGTMLLCGKLNDDLDFERAAMKKGERTENMFWGVNAGCRIPIFYDFSVTPTLGVGWLTLLPGDKAREKNEDLRRAEIKGAKPQPVIGVEVCYEMECGVVEMPKGGYQQLILSPSLRYTYMPVKFNSPTLKTTGAAHTITLGLKYGFEKLRRDY